MKKGKICKLCELPINEAGRYVYLADWNNKKIEADGWYHLNCFLKGMNKEQTEQEEKVKVMLDQTFQLLNQVRKQFPEEIKEFEIK